MILVGNKADLEPQRQVSRANCRDLNPLTDKHAPCLIIWTDNTHQSGGNRICIFESGSKGCSCSSLPPYDRMWVKGEESGGGDGGVRRGGWMERKGSVMKWWIFCLLVCSGSRLAAVNPHHPLMVKRSITGTRASIQVSMKPTFQAQSNMDLCYLFTPSNPVGFILKWQLISLIYLMWWERRFDSIVGIINVIVTKFAYLYLSQDLLALRARF